MSLLLATALLACWLRGCCAGARSRDLELKSGTQHGDTNDMDAAQAQKLAQQAQRIAKLEQAHAALQSERDELAEQKAKQDSELSRIQESIPRKLRAKDEDRERALKHKDAELAEKEADFSAERERLLAAHATLEGRRAQLQADHEREAEEKARLTKEMDKMRDDAMRKLQVKDEEVRKVTSDLAQERQTKDEAARALEDLQRKQQEQEAAHADKEAQFEAENAAVQLSRDELAEQKSRLEEELKEKQDELTRKLRAKDDQHAQIVKQREAEHADRLEHSNAERSRLALTNTNLEGRKAQLQTENDRLAEEKSRLDKELDAVRDEAVRKLQVKEDEMRKAASDLQREHALALKDKASEVTSKITEFEAERRRLQKQQEDLEKKCAHVKDERDALSQERDLLAKQILDVQDDITRKLRAKAEEDLTSQSTEFDSERQRLQNEQRAAEKMRVQLQSQLDALSQERDHLAKELQTTKRSVEEHMRTLLLKETTIADREADFAAERKRLQEGQAYLENRCVQLQADKDVLAGDKTKLAKDLDIQRDDFSRQLQAKQEEHIRAVQQKEAQLTDKDANVNSERQLAQEHALALQLKEADLADKEADFAKERKRLQDDRARLENRRSQLEAERDSLAEDKSKLAKDLDALRDDLSRQLQAKDEERIKAVQQKEAQLTDKDADVNSERKIAQEHARALQLKETELADKENDFAAERKRFQDDQAYLENRRSQLQAERDSLVEDKSKLAKDFDALRDSLSHQLQAKDEERVRALHKKDAELTEKGDDFNSKLKLIQEQQKHAETRRSKLQSEVDALRSEHARQLQAKDEELAHALRQKEAELASHKAVFEGERKSMQDQHAYLQGRHSKLQSDREELLEEKARLTQELDGVQDEANRSLQAREAEELRREAEWQKDRQALQQKDADMAAREAEFHGERQRLRQEKDALARQHSDAQSERDRLLEEKSELESLLKASESAKENELAEKVAGMGEERSKMKEDKTKLMKKLREVQAKCDDLSEDNKMLREELDKLRSSKGNVSHFDISSPRGENKVVTPAVAQKKSSVPQSELKPSFWKIEEHTKPDGPKKLLCPLQDTCTCTIIDDVGVRHEDCNAVPVEDDLQVFWIKDSSHVKVVGVNLAGEKVDSRFFEHESDNFDVDVIKQKWNDAEQSICDVDDLRMDCKAAVATFVDEKGKKYPNRIALKISDDLHVFWMSDSESGGSVKMVGITADGRKVDGRQTAGQVEAWRPASSIPALWEQAKQCNHSVQDLQLACKVSWTGVYKMSSGGYATVVQNGFRVTATSTQPWSGASGSVSGNSIRLLGMTGNLQSNTIAWSSGATWTFKVSWSGTWTSSSGGNAIVVTQDGVDGTVTATCSSEEWSPAVGEVNDNRIEQMFGLTGTLEEGVISWLSGENWGYQVGFAGSYLSEDGSSITIHSEGDRVMAICPSASWSPARGSIDGAKISLKSFDMDGSLAGGSITWSSGAVWKLQASWQNNFGYVNADEMFLRDTKEWGNWAVSSATLDDGGKFRVRVCQHNAKGVMIGVTSKHAKSYTIEDLDWAVYLKFEGGSSGGGWTCEKGKKTQVNSNALHHLGGEVLLSRERGKITGTYNEDDSVGTSPAFTGKLRVLMFGDSGLELHSLDTAFNQIGNEYQVFDDVDTNKDGKISFEELEQAIARGEVNRMCQLAGLERPAPGSILDQLDAGNCPRCAHKFETDAFYCRMCGQNRRLRVLIGYVDTDNDGMISYEEIARAAGAVLTPFNSPHPTPSGTPRPSGARLPRHSSGTLIGRSPRTSGVRTPHMSGQPAFRHSSASVPGHFTPQASLPRHSAASASGHLTPSGSGQPLLRHSSGSVSGYLTPQEPPAVQVATYPFSPSRGGTSPAQSPQLHPRVIAPAPMSPQISSRSVQGSQPLVRPPARMTTQPAMAVTFSSAPSLPVQNRRNVP
eukprot:TRINITY_DN3656_c0_g1_i1.p1 TRINITY_DN3656_c0_g1~~TRINITY_DN3656_c0_g1_i1.p1  ORF type:complete len:1936 (+),score=489.68 TRINITY_DN3656_c0_g1_i1:792-6599(+)